MNEEERDLEAELKEEKDRFEAQNQEAYDKEVSGENEIKRAYEKNRKRLKRLEKKVDPDRFQSQLETIKSIHLIQKIQEIYLSFYRYGY